MKSERSEVKNAAAAVAMVAMVASASFIGYNYEACGFLSIIHKTRAVHRSNSHGVPRCPSLWDVWEDCLGVHLAAAELKLPAAELGCGGESVEGAPCRSVVGANARGFRLPNVSLWAKNTSIKYNSSFPQSS